MCATSVLRVENVVWTVASTSTQGKQVTCQICHFLSRHQPLNKDSANCDETLTSYLCCSFVHRPKSFACSQQVRGEGALHNAHSPQTHEVSSTAVEQVRRRHGRWTTGVELRDCSHCNHLGQHITCSHLFTTMQVDGTLNGNQLDHCLLILEGEHLTVDANSHLHHIFSPSKWEGKLLMCSQTSVQCCVRWRHFWRCRCRWGKVRPLYSLTIKITPLNLSSCSLPNASAQTLHFGHFH